MDGSGRTHLELQLFIGMVEKNFSIVTSLRQMELEINLATKGDMSTEVMPFQKSPLDRMFEGSVETLHIPELSLCILQSIGPFVHFGCHLFNRDAITENNII